MKNLLHELFTNELHYENTQLLIFCLFVGIALLLLTLSTLVVVLFMKVNKRATKSYLELQLKVMMNQFKINSLELEKRIIKDFQDVYESISGCQQHIDTVAGLDKMQTKTTENILELMKKLSAECSAQQLKIERIEKSVFELQGSLLTKRKEIVVEEIESVQPTTENELPEYWHVVVTKIDEERLEYARKHYPVGTVFKSAWDEVEFTSRGKIMLNTYNEYKGDIIDDENGCIYTDGKWAEIISTPEQKETPKYPIMNKKQRAKLNK